MPLITEHIADKLGITPDAAAELVDGFVAGLLDDLKVRGAADIRGLGRFTLSDGELQFDPESRLAAVVNHRFAGLTPIPVDDGDEASLGLGSTLSIPQIPIAADVMDHAESGLDAGSAAIAESAEYADQTLGDESGETHVYYASEDEEDLIVADRDHASTPWASTSDVVDSIRHEVESEKLGEEMLSDTADTDTAGPEPTKESGSWNRPARFQEPDAPNHEFDDDYLAETEFERETEHEHDFGGTLLRPSAPLIGSSEDEEAKPAPEAVDVATPAAGASGPPGEPRVEVRRSSIARTYWFVIPVLVVLTGLVLWLLRQSERTPQTRDSAETEVQQAESIAPAPEDSAEDVAPALDADRGGTQETAVAQPWQPGSVDKRAGGYTIVVSSQASRQEAIEFARNLMADIDEQSLPVDIFRGTTNGRTRYRVGVGQFPSIQTAITEMDRLTSKLPAGAWILRIRSNM